jgi:hypothetical protein
MKTAEVRLHRRPVVTLFERWKLIGKGDQFIARRRI